MGALYHSLEPMVKGVEKLAMNHYLRVRTDNSAQSIAQAGFNP